MRKGLRYPRLALNFYKKYFFLGWVWRHMPLVLAFQRQVDLYEFRASLIYIVGSRTARAT